MPDVPSDRLRMLFERAMALPAAARRAFVDHKCANDADLKQRLGAMLATAGDAQFANGPAAVPPAAAPPASPSAPARPAAHLEGVGSTIGPYRLLQLLGEGGFGAVYLAEQDRPVSRRVALKILKPGMDSEQVVARFEQERQALALMDHPNIAKVFDAGCTATGRPYFVMELCRGEPLVAYCDKNGRTIAERLGLLEQVCHAIQHAHGKGIVHRDLKPSNLLVGVQDGKATVKVIDFGIAKAIAQPLTERPLFTMQQQVIGTLQYMSPEQAEGSLDIDTRTDIYALGVLLYELLTGSTPFDQETLLAAGFSEMHRLIREQEPPKPSTRIHASRVTLGAIAAQRRVEPRRLGTLVRGELDWIAMKAIEKDRQRRYATAEALAQDLHRFRHGEAVVAAPPSRVYLVRKFVRRHRTLVAAAATVALTMLAGVVAFAWQARIAANERDEARAAQGRSEEVAGVMESLFKGIDPRADETIAGTFKDRLIERLDTVAARIATVHDPLARMRLESSFAVVRMGVGDFAKAAASFRTSWEVCERTLGKDHPDTVSAAMELAWAMAQAGQPRQVRRRSPPESLPLAAELNGIALHLLEAGAFVQAEPVLREVVAVRQRQLPDGWQTWNSMALLGEALAGLGQFAVAEPLVTGGSEGVLAQRARASRSPNDWVALAPERVRRFYEAWAAAEPGKDQTTKLAAWLARHVPPDGAAGK